MISCTKKSRRKKEGWHKRKEKGKAVGTGKLSPRKQHQLRKDWRERARQQTRRKMHQEWLEAMLQNNTPPMSPEERMLSPQPPDSRSRLHIEKKLQCKKTEFTKMKEKCIRLVRILKKYKQRLYTMNSVQSNLKKKYTKQDCEEANRKL